MPPTSSLVATIAARGGERWAARRGERAARGGDRRPARDERARRRVIVALWLGAALVAGFTAWNHLEPFDEGLLLQAGLRIVDGQWPYADFAWAYGPGQPLAEALGFAVFGPSVLVWRVLWVASCATIAVLVWWLVRREAGPRWALAAWLAAATTAAQPMLANPVVPAMALALGALAAAVAARPALAGALVALTAFWRPDFGVFALLAVAAALFASPGRRAAGRAALVAAGGAALLYLPFAVAAGPGTLWRALVSSSWRDGEAWRLPFPLLYDGPLRIWPPGGLAHDAKDLLGYELPLAGALGLLAAAATLALRRDRRPAAGGLSVLALGGLAYLVSRSDEFHAPPLLLCLCALVPITVGGGRAARSRRAVGGGAAPSSRARVPAAVAVAAFTLIVAGGLANRLSALGGPEELVAVHLPGVPGIRVPPAEARALPPLVAFVQRHVPPGEPIYVAPRRADLVTSSAPIVHFLVRRPNVLHRDALLHARPAEQIAIVEALRRARPPAVVRWTSPASSRPEPNERGRPSGARVLDAYLAAAYRSAARFGDYEVLLPRP
jgi:hypothetical protein